MNEAQSQWMGRHRSTILHADALVKDQFRIQMRLKASEKEIAIERGKNGNREKEQKYNKGLV